AYAKDNKGVFAHRFGPLNEAGGERRLNVAITRAKMNVKVVSSIKAMDIDALKSQYKLYAFSGIHVFSPSLFPLMEPYPERFGIIDFYLNVCNHSKIKGWVKDDLQLMDVGKIDTLQEAEKFIKNNI
ncbi:MAG: hypothetical protein II624_06935, partial [Prevotella sp.]|nr:hypothetical protein [Prevotella sp.]